MIKPLRINEALELLHQIIINKPTHFVGLVVNDLGTKSWQMFSLDRDQIVEIVEWLNGWLKETETK